MLSGRQGCDSLAAPRPEASSPTWVRVAKLFPVLTPGRWRAPRFHGPGSAALGAGLHHLWADEIPRGLPMDAAVESEAGGRAPSAPSPRGSWTPLPALTPVSGRLAVTLRRGFSGKLVREANGSRRPPAARGAPWTPRITEGPEGGRFGPVCEESEQDLSHSTSSGSCGCSASGGARRPGLRDGSGQQLLRSPEPLFHAAATGPALCRRRRVAPGRPARGLEAEAAARALVPPGGGEGRLPLNPQLSAVRQEIGSCLFSRSWRRGSRRQAFVAPLSCAKSRCGLCGRPQCVTAGREHAATSTSLSKPAFQAQGARSEEQERPQRSCGGGAGC
ncbi:hypothetical protein QTO34_012918 [Cnephaeus nilssonii]|uniref:Uncharacterized protein n=1 Tax=Cnephaeus nilssonii TaxID=3371016 RepID=A0AA40LD29_CNENI|nr:hypothetical protein QTO34_012918 [Eptesicus nilssonii]